MFITDMHALVLALLCGSMYAKQNLCFKALAFWEGVLECGNHELVERTSLC